MAAEPLALRDYGRFGSALGGIAALAIGALLAGLVVWDGRDDLRLQLSLLGPSPVLLDDVPFVASSVVIGLLLLLAGFFAWVLASGGLERPALGLFAMSTVANALPGLTQIALVLLLIVLIRRVLRDGDVPAVLTPLVIPLLLITVSYATAILMTDKWLVVLPLYLFRLTGNLFPVLLLPAILRTRRHIEVFFHMLLVCAWISVCVEWAQWGLSLAAGVPITFNPDIRSAITQTPWGLFPQLTGLMIHPNMQSNCLSTLAILALWFGLRPGAMARGRRVFYLTSFVWLSLGVVFTWSRSGWLALGVAALLLPAVRFPRFAPAYGLICLVLGAAAYQSGLLKAGYELVESMGAASVDFRWRIDLLAMDAFVQHPWLGIGTEQILSYENPWRLQVHDTYLQIVGEMGVFGIISFALLFALGLARMIWTLAVSRFEFDREWTLGLLMASVVALVQNSVVMFLWVRFLWLLIAWVECVHLAARDQSGREPEDTAFLPAARPAPAGVA
jgi:O-antigen ligase